VFSVDWTQLIFPELKQFQPPQRERALREAREDDFDSLERAGIISAVVVASVLVAKLDLEAFAAGNRLVSTVLAFFVAIPVVGAIAGVFMIRRTRRGLRKRLTRGGS